MHGLAKASTIFRFRRLVTGFFLALIADPTVGLAQEDFSVAEPVVTPETAESPYIGPDVFTPEPLPAPAEFSTPAATAPSQPVTPEPVPVEAQAAAGSSAQAGVEASVTGGLQIGSQPGLRDTGEQDYGSGDMELWKRRYRRYNSLEGSTGGIHLVDARSGAPTSVRIQFALNGFASDDFLSKGDEVEQIGQALAVGWTPIEYLEVFGRIYNNSTVVNKPSPGSDDDEPAPRHYNSQGNALLGVKAGDSVTTALALGGDLGIVFPNQSGGIGVTLSGISLGLRGSAEVDLRELDNPAPFIGRVNLRYLFDHSEMLVEDTENNRYDKLSDPKDKEKEVAHLVSREERFGLGINRVDFFSVGLGVELPLEVAEEFYLHPALEWNVSVPFNRRGFTCVFVKEDSEEEGEAAEEGGYADDGCMEKEGVDAIPMLLTLGVRVVTPIRGLSTFLGADIGLTGTSSFVRELAPTAPFQLLFALSYDFDARPAALPAVQTPAPPVELANASTR
ncbi:MAG: hypothetical protein JXA30_06585 [Deltaproteobacteria bacterium]|nr:hypothetical protein [Deltaproteobacteria bacterium]